MKWKEEQKIEIAGHTDNVGKDADNLKLSLQRAEAVRNYLIKKGIKADRITAKGYGATQPVADNGTDAGRQKNRRTEVVLL
jgi:OOP family OmpA-OmpF porin